MTGSGETLIDHVTVTVTDLDRSRQFYDAALAPVGILRLVDYEDPEDGEEAGVEAVGYGGVDGRIVLWLVAGPTPTTNVHLAVRARDRSAVQAFFDAAIGVGAAVHRPPRSWMIYRPSSSFSAMVGDPDGNIIEADAPSP